jgi:hypothetical protein
MKNEFYLSSNPFKVGFYLLLFFIAFILFIIYRKIIENKFCIFIWTWGFLEYDFILLLLFYLPDFITLI